MSETTTRRGARGEEIACLFLESRGYRVLARNFRVGRRELDIIAERGELLVVVEVKWRRAQDGGRSALEAWTAAQRSRAGEAVLLAMETLPGGRTRPWRLDVVAIAEDESGLMLQHRRGVWSPSGSFW